jgi:hypothetical protein
MTWSAIAQIARARAQRHPTGAQPSDSRTRATLVFNIRDHAQVEANDSIASPPGRVVLSMHAVCGYMPSGTKSFQKSACIIMLSSKFSMGYTSGHTIEKSPSMGNMCGFMQGAPM